MEIVPNISLEQVVAMVCRVPRSALIVEAALGCVKHEPQEREVLKARIEKIVKKMALSD